jgi:hypothetical protein
MAIGAESFHVRRIRTEIRWAFGDAEQTASLHALTERCAVPVLLAGSAVREFPDESFLLVSRKLLGSLQDVVVRFGGHG